MNMMAPSFAAPLREPPADLEAEQQLLSELLAQPHLFDSVTGIITAGDFSDPAHAEIFEHASGMNAKQGDLILSRLAKAVETLPGTAALGGKEYITDLALNALRIFTPVSIVSHARYIAELSKRRQLIAIASDFADAAYVTDHSVAAQVAELEREIEALATVPDNMPTLGDGVVEALADFESAYVNGGGIQGLSTSYPDLDELLGGLEPGNVYVLAARPGMGKTALANNIGFNLAANGGNVAIFNLEMPQKQIAGRMICMAAGVPLHNARRGRLQPQDFERLEEARRHVASFALAIDDTPGVSPSYIRSKCAELNAKRQLDLVIVDYLQLMETDSESRFNNRNNEITEISKAIKTLAKSCNVPVIVLSQLNRGVEARDDKRPNLSDLRESGAIEQDADVVMFLYREEYYLRKAEPDPSELDKVEAWTMKMEGAKGKAELDVAKNRHGPDGRVMMRFNGPLMKFASQPTGHAHD